jgi:hypothetical protein
MKRICEFFFLASFLGTGIAQADCASMWVTRNMVFDQAGYCFGSTLGKSVFDNSDCTPGDVTLTAAERDFVEYTRDMEAEFACEIDTSQTTLELDATDDWLRLEDLPYRDLTESGCIGWLGQTLPLRSAANDRSPVIGQILPGDMVVFAHIDIRGFSFVEAVREGARSDVGWVRIMISPKVCEALAG